MVPQLDADDTPSSTTDMLDSEFVMSEFLHDMDELDLLQALQCDDFALKRELGDETEPALKRAKTMKRAESSQPSSSSCASQVTSKPSTTKRRSTSWFRRKQELHSLRGESEELEKRLDFLQLRRAQTSRHQSSATLSETQATWQSVAALARQECEKAQNENSRLKNELQMYSRASDKLQAHLTASESILDLKNDVRVGVVLSLRLHSNNSAVFGMLESRIYGRLHELNSIVREARYPADGGTTEVVQICRESGESSASAVELKHVRLLPFGEDTTSKNLWEIIELGGVVFKNDTRVAWSTPDTAGLVSCHSVPLGDKFDVTVDVHTVIKRFAMTTGMVALIESRSEWSIEYPTSLVARSTMSEKGWFMVHEYPKACTVSGGATQRASQLRTSVKIRPHEPRKSSSLTSTIVDVVIPSSSSIMSSYLQAIENFMLDSDHVVTRQ